MNYSKPVLGIAAFSGTGKTTPLKQLISLLLKRACASASSRMHPRLASNCIARRWDTPCATRKTTSLPWRRMPRSRRMTCRRATSTMPAAAGARGFRGGDAGETGGSRVDSHEIRGLCFPHPASSASKLPTRRGLAATAPRWKTGTIRSIRR
jgi:hypothetical protein